MSMSDPIADLLTRIRNAHSAGHRSVSIPRSKLKLNLVRLLRDEGFLSGVAEDDERNFTVFLKYSDDQTSAIRGLHRVSKPSRRVYVGRSEVPRVRNGLGIAVLSTSHPKGLLTDREARKLGLGGEVICYVW